MKALCEGLCADVEPIMRLPSISIDKRAIDKGAIRLVLVSEAMPEEAADYFDGPGEPRFIQTTNAIFSAAGFDFHSYADYLERGIYLTTALKCAKKGSAVATATIESCSRVLERELAAFAGMRAIMAMGDVAIKAINSIWKRKQGERAIPAGSTYKIRSGVYASGGIRFFPSYTQTGDSFGLEKSKVAMMAQDVKAAMDFLDMG